MRVFVVAAVATAALVVAAPAAAKEASRIVVCGASGCRTITDRALLRDDVPSGEQTEPLGRPAPYYRVEVVHREPDGHEFSFFLYSIPSARAVAWAEDGLVRQHPIFGNEANAQMRRLTAGVRPYPAPRVTATRIGSRVVTGDDAASYLALFAYDAKGPLVESPGDWVGIDFRSTIDSPWTVGRPDLVYSPSANLLEHGWNRVEVPDWVASDVEAGRAIRADERPAAWWAVVVAPVSLLAAGAALWRRRRSGARA